MFANQSTSDNHRKPEPTAAPATQPGSQPSPDAPHWRRHLLAVGLVIIWAMTLRGLPPSMPVQIASWLTFIALLVTPGYLLAEMIVWRSDLDWIERLALAFPLSIVVLSVPGMVALLQHGTLTDLIYGWQIAGAVVAGGWFAHFLWRRNQGNQTDPWTWDQIALLLVVGAAYILALPTLAQYKIDGDAYAVSSFTADALAGLPLNAAEPVFGTNLGPGVRMAFNQSLPMVYLWSWFSGIDPIPLTATASRSMIALWALFASYMLGRAAGLFVPGGGNGRRFGLFVAAIQMLIYLAAPFLRGDNVSLFFFERTTADKFMVPITMLPVVFALTIRYLGRGRGNIWFAAAVASFAVSTIHPLIAAMMALALTAFGLLHWLLNLRNRQAFWRCTAVAALVVIVMVVPLLQLVLSRGEAPLASSYPTSIEGWPVGHKLVPALPFIDMPTMDVYGPLPDLARMDAIEANSDTNPFLIWRFAVNMNRRRLILFDLAHYISDPNIILEPPYLLAILLLPGLLWKLRRNLGAQFAISTTLSIIFIMFNPFVTPLLGELVMPWILWRFVWMLPYALIMGLIPHRVLYALTGMGRPVGHRSPRAAAYAPLATIAVAALLLAPSIANTLEDMKLRAAYPYYYPTPERIFSKLDELTTAGGPATVLADQDLSVTIPAYVAQANVIAHRVPTTSEIFPANLQVEALQRLIDQENFFRNRYLTQDAMAILDRYAVDYIVTTSASNLDQQLRAAPHWFTWIEDDQTYSLYAVHELPESSSVVDGNTAMADRLWPLAERFYRAALDKDPHDIMAILGLAEIAHAQGQFTEAVNWLNAAMIHSNEPSLHYRLGQIYTEMGESDRSVTEFTAAHNAAPEIARFSLALGEACLNRGDLACADGQFALAAAHGNQPDPVAQLITRADLWRQHNRLEEALTLYEDAVEAWPSQDNRLMLAAAYLEAGRYTQANALLTNLIDQHPLQVEAINMLATVQGEQKQFTQAEQSYRKSIRLQKWLGQASIETSLALVQLLLDADRLDEAAAELKGVFAREPYNAAAYGLQGDLLLRQRDEAGATQAYQHAFRLDPTQVNVYVALSNQLRQQGGRQDDSLGLLEQAMKANPDEAMLALALGDQAERRGEIDAAVDAYQAALDMFEGSSNENLNPRSRNVSRAYAFTRLASVSEDKGELAPAMNYYRAAVAAVPDLPWPQVILGDALRRRGDAAGAIDAYETAISNDDRQADAYMRLADLHHALGESAKAEAYRQQALRLAAIDVPVGGRIGLSAPAPTDHLLANAYQSDETLAQAAPQRGISGSGNDATSATNSSVLRLNGLNLDSANEENLRLLARIYRSSQETEVAMAFYRELIARGEAEGWYATLMAEYHKGLGDLLLIQDEPAEAAVEYQKSIALDDWWPQPRLGLARALADQSLLDDAIEELRAAVSIAPGYVEAQVALAGALEAYGLPGDALEIYKETAATHSGNANATLAYARALQNRGLTAEAELVYEKTLTLNPGSADAHIGLAAMLIEQARYADARPLLEEAVAIDQQNVNAYIQWGVLEQQTGHPDTALEWFMQAITLRVDSPAVGVTLIDQLQRSGQYEPALAYIHERLQKQPNNLDLLLRQAEIQRALGYYSDALVTLLQAENNGLNDARLAAELGELHLSQGRLRQGLAAYQQAINLQPDERSYYLRAGEIWRTLGEFDKAIAILKTGVSHVVQPASLYAAIAETERVRGDQQAARALLEQAMLIVGDDTELMLAMGAYYESIDIREAERWYTDLLALRPNNADIHVALGTLYLERRNWDEALAHLNAAAELNPQDAGHFNLLAYADNASGQVDLAITAYEHALALEPTQIDTYTDLAALYVKRGDVDTARELYERGMKIAPTDGSFLIAYIRFIIEQDGLQQGLALLDAADQLAPTAEMMIARAELYESLGRTADAERDLRAAIQKAPGAVEAYVALSDLFQKAGDLKQAQEVIEELSKRIPGLRS